MDKIKEIDKLFDKIQIVIKKSNARDYWFRFMEMSYEQKEDGELIDKKGGENAFDELTEEIISKYDQIYSWLENNFSKYSDEEYLKFKLANLFSILYEKNSGIAKDNNDEINDPFERMFYDLIGEKIDRLKGQVLALSLKIGQNSISYQKLKWNLNSNLLIDLFYQLKRINTGGNKSLIPNSNADIALFLKNNFSVFDKTKISTIELQLNKTERPKSKDRIIIHNN